MADRFTACDSSKPQPYRDLRPSMPNPHHPERTLLSSFMVVPKRDTIWWRASLDFLEQLCSVCVKSSSSLERFPESSMHLFAVPQSTAFSSNGCLSRLKLPLPSFPYFHLWLQLVALLFIYVFICPKTSTAAWLVCSTLKETFAVGFL